MSEDRARASGAVVSRLKISRPDDDKDEALVLEQVEPYVRSVVYLAAFVEFRAGMGDMSVEEVLEETLENIGIALEDKIMAGHDQHQLQ